ncbi:hypothetical protein PR202_ga08471 [Eleusine coracana subsp. coracana]|uniref:Uncharacterized protein n=1 Tax=Eleusine coracana subsp. coracana TaxID=191504 RepID=A0AAV5C1U8_ELECO|nr:hypothetical protein PR202_ga08471 [Eleusine coracana subsp. coracana]
MVATGTAPRRHSSPASVLLRFRGCGPSAAPGGGGRAPAAAAAPACHRETHGDLSVSAVDRDSAESPHHSRRLME